MQHTRVQELKQKGLPLARVAYAIAILFAIRLASFFVPAFRDTAQTSSPLLNELICLFGIAPHLLLFPVIAALPAPQWARSAGYGWLVVDMATDIMQLNGVSPAIFLALRYGGHISAALWIASASWQAKGATRIVGLLFALDLGGYSFITPFDPTHFIGLLPSLILLPLWFLLMGRAFAREVKGSQYGLRLA